MCGGSRHAKKTVVAAQGASFAIGTIKTHGEEPVKVGALHTEGETALQCTHCIQTGQILTLSNIPFALQQKYDIGVSAKCMFTENNWSLDDLVSFDNGRTAEFAEFADQGVTAYTGELVHDTKQTVDGIIASANEAAARSQHDQPAPTATTQRPLVDA